MFLDYCEVILQQLISYTDKIGITAFINTSMKGYKDVLDS